MICSAALSAPRSIKDNKNSSHAIAQGKNWLVSQFLSFTNTVIESMRHTPYTKENYSLDNIMLPSCACLSYSLCKSAAIHLFSYSVSDFGVAIKNGIQ